ncbi:MAG: HAD-IIB family hydrolase [Thermodesulfobacteriota bacterium]
MNRHCLIFSDLDGTLLEHTTYSFEAAKPALNALKLRNIPLIFCSSKTRPEIEMYRELTGNRHPFISENGGGIYFPRDYDINSFNYDTETNDYKVIVLGTKYDTLVEVLNSIRNDTRIKLKSYSEMKISEISEYTGLDPRLAKLSKMREYDEPFIIFGSDKVAKTIKEEIIGRGFNHTQGAIFHHIMGKNDKGKAVQILVQIFKNRFRELNSAGLGDSLNDLPMLEVVDIPILVQRPDGKYDQRISIDNLIYADGVGPVGWNRSVLKLLGIEK